MRKFITETIIISKEELIGKIQQYVQEATGYNGSIKINLTITQDKKNLEVLAALTSEQFNTLYRVNGIQLAFGNIFLKLFFNYNTFPTDYKSSQYRYSDDFTFKDNNEVVINIIKSEILDYGG